MGTKTQTTSNQQSNLQYDPTSLGRYNRLTGGAANVLSQYMNNPFGNQFYRLGQSAGQAGANKLGQQNINAFMQNYLTSGFGGQSGAAFKTAQMGQIGRANQGLRSQANLANIMGAYQRQLGAAGQGLMFQPLMTGTSSQGSQTQSTGGLGTWLPQVISGGLSAAMMGMGGGFGGGGGFTGSSVPGGLPASATAPISPMNIPSGGFGAMPNLSAGTGAMPIGNPFLLAGQSGAQWGY